MITEPVAYEGETWRYIFHKPDGVLSDEDRRTLVRGAIELYRTGRTTKTLKGQEFEGALKNTRQTARIGSFHGNLVEGHIETDKGKADVGVMLWQYSPPHWN